MVSGFCCVQAFATFTENDVTLEAQQAHPKGLVRLHVGSLYCFLECAEAATLFAAIDRPSVVAVRFFVAGHSESGGRRLLGMAGAKSH